MVCVCLEKNNHQGWYGECFVQVLAAAAGLACSPLTPDCTGVDFDITYPGVLGEETFPEIKVQVKSWSDPKTDPDDLTQWRYPRLTQKRFNALAGKFRVPRFLFMVVVPEVREQYADADEDRLMLSHAAYWASLEDHERIAEPSCEVRQPVLIPKANLLTTSSLISLFEPVYAVEGAS